MTGVEKRDYYAQFLVAALDVQRLRKDPNEDVVANADNVASMLLEALTTADELGAFWDDEELPDGPFEEQYHRQVAP